MHAEIEDDEALLVIEIGLALVDVVAGAEADPRPGRRRRSRLHRAPPSLSCSGVWKRKFSCTARKSPAFSAPFTILTQSSQFGANGFCTIVGTLWRKAISASATMRVHAGDDVDQTEIRARGTWSPRPCTNAARRRFPRRPWPWPGRRRKRRPGRHPRARGPSRNSCGCAKRSRSRSRRSAHALP